MATLAAMPTRSRSLAAQPLPPTPLQAPTPPASPGFNYQPPSIGAAPTPTPTGTFQAPDPSQLANDKYYQFRQSEMQKGLQRGAAARGSLLSGRFQSELADRIGMLASAEGDKVYGRALSDYTTNRDTNAQNYGQSLSGYQAGTGAALDAGRLGLAGAQATYGAQRDAYGDAREAAATQTGVLNANQQAQAAYAQIMQDYRASLEAQQADAAASQPAGSRPGARPRGFGYASRPLGSR